MSIARQLHREAMNTVSEAQSALMSGETDRHDILLRHAFEKERAAAWELLHKLDAEPTRSILFRSAAQLAIESGEFKEAEKLVAAALFGNPPIELVLELRELNQQIANYLDWVQFLENPAIVHEYLQNLRQKALNVRLKPKNPTHGSAVLLDNVVDMLKKVKESFFNYLDIDFRKVFVDKFENIDKLIADLKREANPLIVNLKFQSFAASIAPDLHVMLSQQYSDDIREWKENVFERFKDDVFQTDYNSVPEVRPLADKYSPEERRRIFSPIIDLFKDSNQYNFSLTDTSFVTIKRKYRPVSKPVRDLLIPVVQGVQEPKNLELFQSFGLAPAESGGALSKSNIISAQTMTTADFRVVLSEIHFEKQSLILSEPLEIEIHYEKPIFSINSELLQIRVNSYHYNNLLNDFQQSFIELFNNLKGKSEKQLTADELSIYNFIKSVVFTETL